MAAPTIVRTADVDDDGTLTTGTVYNNAWKTALYNAIDTVIAALYTALVALIGAPPVPRVTGTTSSATPTPNADLTDVYSLTAQAAAAAFGNPTGTPVNGQILTIRIKDNATARALTWGSAYVEGGAPLPTTTVVSKILTIRFVYNTDNTLNKWQCVEVAQEGFSLVHAKAFKSSGVQSLPDSTFTAVTFDAESYDTGALHDTVTNNTRLTIPVGADGLYFVAATVTFAGNATGLRNFSFKKNGTTFFGGTQFVAAAITQTAQAFDMAVLAAGDYVEVFAFQSSGGALNVNASVDSTSFIAVKLS